MREQLRRWLRDWLGITADMQNISAIHSTNAELQHELPEIKQRIEDIESAIPKLPKLQAAAEAAKPEPVMAGFVPFSQRKRQWEASRSKKAEKK